MKQGSIVQQVQTGLSSIQLRGHPLRVILLLALLNGLLYFLLIPPWWHYDEPGQFEYAWLIANRSTWPKQGEHDETMRREMARSMQRYGWYAVRNYTPDFSSKAPIWIGAAQTGGQPAYYFLAAMPLRLVRGADITLQYDLTRLISLLLYLLTILVIWKAMGELVPKGHPLQWIVTAFIALLPAFTDTMTSVNDDVGAILISCIFLWLSLQMVKRGFSIVRLALWGITLALCYLTKNTTWYALLLAPFILLYSLLRGRSTRLIWGATAVPVLAFALITFEGGGAASWFQNRTQTPPLRLETPRAVFGKYAFEIDYSGGRRPQQTGQFLSEDLIRALRGKTVTLGVWGWADETIQAKAPAVRFATVDRGFVDTAKVPIRVWSKPFFYRTVIGVPSNAAYAMVIPPYVSLKGTRAKLYFDGFVLVEGEYPTGFPQFSDPSASQGIWNGHPFRNLIDNASAEQGALRVRPAIDRETSRFLSHFGTLSSIFSTLGDWQGTGWYYSSTFWTMFRTFWASVAADKFNLPGRYPNDFLFLLTILGLAGSIHLIWRKRWDLRWDLIYILLVTLVLAWAIAAARGISNLSSPFPVIPWARYAFPGILPTALLICAGWLEWLELLGEKYNLSRELIHLVPIGLMIGLSLFTLFNVVKYFHPSIMDIEWLFVLLGLQYLAFIAILWGADRLKASSQ
jgi:hypothetical protein